jgi:hypothetical protein
MELVIVVVLDDGEAMPPRELQQPDPARRRERDRRRKLMMGRHEHRADPLLFGKRGEMIDRETLRVHRNRDDPRARQRHHLASAPVAWILDRDDVARPQEPMGDDGERALRAARNQQA